MTDIAASLITALDALAGRKFAVVDAARFDDLRVLLADAGLAFTPLYRDEADEEVEAAGPFLVSLPDRTAARRLLALAGPEPAIVWWAWPDQGEDTEGAIERHLRTINMVEIPLDRPDGEPFDTDEHGLGEERAALAADHGAEPGHGHHHAHDEAHGHQHDHTPPELPELLEPVLFRHADPNVMAMLLPLLDAGQVSRLMGDATGIVVDAPDAGALRSFPRPNGLPEKPAGWLKISGRQYGALGWSQLDRTRHRIVDFLRKTAPGLVNRTSEQDLVSNTASWMGEAKSFGVRSEAALGRWCYLQLITVGSIGKNRDIVEFVSGQNPGNNRSATADERVRILMTMAAVNAHMVRT
jgi:hypothetical protein